MYNKVSNFFCKKKQFYVKSVADILLNVQL